jgi:hypothetical protein
MLANVLRLVVVSVQTKKRSQTQATANQSDDQAVISTLEVVVNNLEAYLEQIRQQKQTIGTGSYNEATIIVRSINAKLGYLQKRIDAEVDNNLYTQGEVGAKSNNMSILNENIARLKKLQEKKDLFLKEFRAEKSHLLAQAKGNETNTLYQLVSNIPIPQRLTQIEKVLNVMHNTFIGLTNTSIHTNVSVEYIKQFVDVTPKAIKQLDQTIKDCWQDVNISSHLSTAKVQERQLNELSELSEQLRQFTADFDDFSKKIDLSLTLETDDVALPPQKVYTLPELEIQAQELWKDYHPESDEVFWELYNELLAKVRK